MLPIPRHVLKPPVTHPLIFTHVSPGVVITVSESVNPPKCIIRADVVYVGEYIKPGVITGSAVTNYEIAVPPVNPIKCVILYCT